MIAETQVGIQNIFPGNRTPIRTDRSGAMVVVRPRTRFQEAVLQGNVFALSQTSTTNYTVGAGNYLAAGAFPAAGALTNFALWNPVGSGKNLVLWQFNFFNTSGTPAAGPIWYVLFNSTPVSVPSTGGIRNLNGSSGGSVANCLNVAAAVALAGSLASNAVGGFYALGHASFTYQSAIPVSTLSDFYPTTDYIDGTIIIPQGFGWIPMMSGAGTTPLANFSVIWEEIPA